MNWEISVGEILWSGCGDVDAVFAVAVLGSSMGTSSSMMADLR